MKHFWKKLKIYLLAFVIYFVFGLLISGINNDMIWGIYALVLLVGFPLYFVYMVISEINYHKRKNSPINNQRKISKVDSEKPFEKKINESTLSQKNITVQENKINEHTQTTNSESNDSLVSTAKSTPKSLSSTQQNRDKDSPTTLDDLGIKVTFKPLNKVNSGRKASSNITIHHLRRKLYNFVVVDTETTGLAKDSKIIQLSAIRYEHDKPVEEFNKYINPGFPIPPKITVLTGIDNKQLQGAPKINEVINSFMTFVGTLPWIGHNINKFDIPRLINNGFPISEVSTIDTLKLAKKKLHMNKYGLEELKHYYGIQNRSHNALEDCKTNALVYQRLRDDDLIPVQADYSNVPQTLAGLNFAISGAFSGYSKKDIKDLIKSHGGNIKSTVTHDTDYLVDGKQVSEHLTDGVHSAKELKARDYGTKVISLSELIDLIGE